MDMIIESTLESPPALERAFESLLESLSSSLLEESA